MLQLDAARNGLLDIYLKNFTDGELLADDMASDGGNKIHIAIRLDPLISPDKDLGQIREQLKSRLSTLVKRSSLYKALEDSHSKELDELDQKVLALENKVDRLMPYYNHAMVQKQILGNSEIKGEHLFQGL